MNRELFPFTLRPRCNNAKIIQRSRSFRAPIASNLYEGTHMRLAGIMLLLLGLAGCTSSGSWFQRDDDPKPAPMANTAVPQQSAPQQALPPRGGPSNLSPAATAAAPAEATTGGGGGEL